MSKFCAEWQSLDIDEKLQYSNVRDNKINAYIIYWLDNFTLESSTIT